jgi:Flavin-binding monooxygenase-like
MISSAVFLWWVIAPVDQLCSGSYKISVHTSLLFMLLLFAAVTIAMQEVSFADGSTAEVDTVIMCTGYDYSFPFLESACSSSSSSSSRNSDTKLDLSWSDKHVQPLYQQIFHAQRIDLSFIGLPHSVVPFPLFELQAKLVAAVYTGAVQLPDITGILVHTRNYLFSIEQCCTCILRHLASLMPAFHCIVDIIVRLMSLSHC